MSVPPQQPTPPPPGQQPWQPPTDPAAAAPRKGLSTGAIVGIIAGVVALLICVCAGVAVVIGLRAGDEVKEAVESIAASPSAGGDDTCVWLPADRATNPALIEVGTPPTDVATTGTQTMTMNLNSGVIEIEVATAEAPCAAASMTYLAGRNFFDDTTCHRLTTEGIQVLQCGDPGANSTGGPTYQFAEENLPNSTNLSENYPIGTIAMARTQTPATTGSQFFLVWGPTPLPGDYTILGKITKGLDVVQNIGAAGAVSETGTATTDGKPKNEVKVNSITVTPAR